MEILVFILLASMVVVSYLIINKLKHNIMFYHEGNFYYLVDRGKMKDRISNHWVSCILYVDADKGDGQIYVIEEEEFYRKFELVDPKKKYEMK